MNYSFTNDYKYLQPKVSVLTTESNLELYAYFAVLKTSTKNNYNLHYTI